MLLDRFRQDRRGNVVPIFALAIIPVIGFVGAAVDYGRAAAVRTSMQAALDATALALSKEAIGMTADQLNEKGRQLFNATFRKSAGENVQFTTQFAETATGFNLKVSASGQVDTTFARVLGQDYVQIGSSSEVTWGIKKLELALALDSTLSMDQANKMTELKKAAKSLVDTLKTAAKKPDDIKIGIVPFSVHVNVDSTANVDADWLDWTDWLAAPAVMANWIDNNTSTWARTGPGTNCPFTTGNHGFRCSSGPAGKDNDSTVSTIPSTGTNAGLICPSRDDGSKSNGTTGALHNRYYNGCYNSVEKPSSDWHTVATGSSASCGSTPNCSCSGSGSSKVCKQKTYDHEWRPASVPAASPSKSTWNGCVRDREQNYDANDTTPLGNETKFQPYQYYRCPQPIQRLTSDWNKLHTQIDALTTVDATNVTIGLAWAWHMLTPNAPMTDAAQPDPAKLNKAIILLTDGLNTQNRWRKFNSSGDSEVDKRTKLACEKAREAKINVYAIRVIEGNAALLRDHCATKPSMYFDVQSASELSGVFNTIAKDLASLRIAK